MTSPSDPETPVPGSEPAPAVPADPKLANELTPEEQMERFERELKETDWGHQPC